MAENGNVSDIAMDAVWWYSIVGWKPNKGTMNKPLTGCTENVAAGELPHACQELGETTTEDGHANNNIRCSYMAGIDIIEGKYERRRRKREQPT